VSYNSSYRSSKEKSCNNVMNLLFNQKLNDNVTLWNIHSFYSRKILWEQKLKPPCNLFSLLLGFFSPPWAPHNFLVHHNFYHVTFTTYLLVFSKKRIMHHTLKLISMQTELSKTVRIFNESQVFLYVKSLSLKKKSTPYWSQSFMPMVT